MAEHLVFLTGRLAEPRLRRVLAGMGVTPFTWDVRLMGVQVAALMTTEIVRRRLGAVGGASRVMLPGRFRGDLAALEQAFGVPFERGPDELSDLPRHLGRAAARIDLTRHDCRIFAEIVDAPTLAMPAILERAAYLRAEGADVIDLGCLPATPFPHLADAVHALKQTGHRVSVDSGDAAELACGARAGADFLLSLSEPSLDLAFETDAVPVLIPARAGDLDSLVRACERLDRAGRPYLADPILDPIHMGFVESLARYRELRRLLPEAAMLMGVGNLTELTDADTTGVTMTLLAVCSELRIGNVLVVQVSPHCRRAVREAELARRILLAAREEGSPPQWIDPGLLCLRDRRPFASSKTEITESAAAVRDPSFRIEVAEDGIHVYNRDGHHLAADPFELFPKLGVEADGPHAFYLGVELARAQIALQLGKRYSQDEALRWGCAVDRPAVDGTHLKVAGTTLAAKRRR